jgi:hypothetical protein
MFHCDESIFLHTLNACLKPHAFTIENVSVGYKSAPDVLEGCKFQNARPVILYYKQSDKKSFQPRLRHIGSKIITSRNSFTEHVRRIKQKLWDQGSIMYATSWILSDTL